MERKKAAGGDRKSDDYKRSLPQNSAEAIRDKSAGETAQKIAEKAGVSRDTVRKVEKIEEDGDEETRQRVASGEMSINKAYQEVKAQTVAEAGGDHGNQHTGGKPNNVKDARAPEGNSNA